jgi:hypothetical protein
MPQRSIYLTLRRSIFAMVALLAAGGAVGGTAGCDPTIADFMIGGVGPGSTTDFLPDFPAEPISDGTVPSSVIAGLSEGFKNAKISMSPGPCLLEPTLDAMYPLNFSPPLFEWSPLSPQNIFEIRLHIDNQKNDLVLYTTRSSYTLDAAMWSGLVQHSAGRDVRITLRAGQLQGSTLMGDIYEGTSGLVHIAPVSAPGSIVYWTTSGGSALKGFRIGDIKATAVMSPQTMRAAAPGDDTQCVGCHTSTPDGLLAFMGRSSATMNANLSIDARRVDGSSARPAAAAVSGNALSLLITRFQQFMPTFSPAHYSDTDAVVINVGGNDPYGLVWTDLHAVSGGSGFINRQGDTRSADSPSFSRDGTVIAYTSADRIAISIAPSVNDIYTVPYNTGFGGTASPLAGASDPNWNEYYPTYSPNDTFIAFSRIPVGGIVYDAAQAEVFVVPGRGGEATRLRANDPPACAKKPSPGITNSYPRWAPQAIADGAKRYYWMVFSSKRRDNPLASFPLPQLYLSLIVATLTSTGEVIEKTYPAIYIPAQVPSESNHTPAWDVFQIPAAG